jgi:hypothetical protein
MDVKAYLEGELDKQEQLIDMPDELRDTNLEKDLLELGDKVTQMQDDYKQLRQWASREGHSDIVEHAEFILNQLGRTLKGDMLPDIEQNQEQIFELLREKGY